MTFQHRTERDVALREWTETALHTRGLAGTTEPALIAGDASFRRFWRIAAGEHSLIAMDAPPASENNAQFVRLARAFGALGVDVPEVLAFDLERGFLLVTDMGEAHYGDLYGTSERSRLFDAALENLVRLQRMGNSTGLVPPYTAARFFDEIELFFTWFVQGLLALPVDAAWRRTFDTAGQLLIQNILEQPRVCVHRDYHSRNLLWGTDRRTKIVDFQDALWGPIAYDLASLLRDCYVRLPEAEIARHRTRWLELAARDGMTIDAVRFARWLDLTAVQRQLKAVGIFARLKLRDGRPTHLLHIVPVLDHLIDVCAAYPELAALGNYVARLRPSAARALGVEA
jgi:aminoglycoside/choline kinase family phosphotransferase